jgi:photoactive yellow protein
VRLDGKRALIVDDSADLAELLELVLSTAGHEVETTPSGLSALLRFSERAFDLVLLDMQIEDLSGPGASRAIRDMAPTAVVIAMSAQRGGWIDDALDQGATACLPKPFSPEQLVALIDTIAAGMRPPPDPPGDVRTLGPTDLARLAALGPDELDALAFGAIRVDRAGRVTAYNAYEARTARRSPAAVVGAPLADLAPCLMVKQFLSSVEEGLARGRMDRVLRFVFPRHGACCVVAVRLYYDPEFQQMWLFISPARGQAQASGSERG